MDLLLTACNVSEGQDVIKNLRKENAQLRDLLLNGKGELWRFGQFKQVNPSITIQTIMGEKICVSICSTSTIEDIKKKVEIAAGIPFSAQRIIFNGRILLNHRMAIHYQITNGSLLYLVIRIQNKDKWWPKKLTESQRRDMAIDAFNYKEIEERYKRMYKWLPYI